MIETEHLTKKLGDLTAFQDLSFHVEEGEVLAFLGQMERERPQL
jgi:ABC-type multidrug transport system ATPase subunit